MTDRSDILKRQAARLRAIRLAASKKAKMRAVKAAALVKPAPPVAPVAPAVAVPVVKDEPKVAKEPAKAVKEAPAKKKFRGKPANGDAKWILTPANAEKLKAEGLAEDYSFGDLREVGYQYDVRGSSKIELAFDIIKAAKELLR